MNKTELEAILVVARSAAREAAMLAQTGFRRHPVVEHKGAVDLVTQFDRDSEALLRARLGAALPFDIVGEEEGGTWNRAAPAFFIDPIDGTTNFVHGHPFWCVSVGLVVAGQPTLGVVVAPSLRLEWYGYVADGGERLSIRHGDEGEEPCIVSGMTRFEDSLLATGFPYDRRTSADNNFDAFVAIKQRCQAVRRCGSAALDLCMVADGTYEGYWERKLRPWDIAGGIAIVRGAGGRVSEFEGGTECMTSGHVVATNGHIHDALLGELARVKPLSIPPATP
ncbi:MAG: Inositol-monophosphatase [Myxococcaceae bacterium]|jgi:myo-inositol-1(or 4)-monophosphatase|nr:Inositol-monophosphatase [Myxococcaceae bacterium]MEA2746199.1 monophosphatase [Myxococcales bacterium]